MCIAMQLFKAKGRLSMAELRLKWQLNHMWRYLQNYFSFSVNIPLRNIHGVVLQHPNYLSAGVRFAFLLKTSFSKPIEKLRLHLKHRRLVFQNKYLVVKVSFICVYACNQFWHFFLLKLLVVKWQLRYSSSGLPNRRPALAECGPWVVRI